MKRAVVFLLCCCVSSVAFAAPSLLVLEKNGTVSRWTRDRREQIAIETRAIDIATCNDGVTWVLTDHDVHALYVPKKSEARRPKQRKMRFVHGVALGCAAQLYAATADGTVTALSLNEPARAVDKLDRVRFFFNDAQHVFAATEHALVAIEDSEKYPLAALPPIAAAATPAFMYVIDRDGNFRQIDRRTHQVTDLNFGLWFGALGLIAIEDTLYIATAVGKFWRIVPRTREKEMLDADGWQQTLSLTRGEAN